MPRNKRKDSRDPKARAVRHRVRLPVGTQRLERFRASAALLLTASFVLVFSALAPPTALAATASVETKSTTSQEIGLFYQAAAGETNDISVDQSALGSYAITDRGAVIEAGHDCRSVSLHGVVCRAKSDRIIVNLRGSSGNDRLVMSLIKNPKCFAQILGNPGPATVLGGPGQNTFQLAVKGSLHHGPSGSAFTTSGLFCGTYFVDSGTGSDTIFGSKDDDYLLGGCGANRIYGGGGNDVIVGGTRNDYLEAGPGASVIFGDNYSPFNFGLTQCPLQPPDHDVLKGGPGPVLFAPGRGPTYVAARGGHGTLLYVAPQAASGRRQAPPHVSIKFDGRYDSGPPGYHDDVAPGITTVISIGSGQFALRDSLALKAGRYVVMSPPGLPPPIATITLLSSRGTAGAERGTFSGGDFGLHPRTEGGVAELDLRGGASRAQVCGRAGRAHVAASRRVLRRLLGKAHGPFRTRGRYSATTVRGTEWETIDRCDGTVTRVERGTAIVRDFRQKKNIVVRAGQSYLASGSRAGK